MNAMSELSKRNLIINSTNAKMSDIERHVRQAGKLDLIVIDHLGLIIPDKVTDSLYLPTTMACHALKRLDRVGLIGDVAQSHADLAAVIAVNYAHAV